MNANNLIAEMSPYLLQHAYNPVHWYPWGDEAFSKAETEDKPVFLSIGYSTCHWLSLIHISLLVRQMLSQLSYAPTSLCKQQKLLYTI